MKSRTISRLLQVQQAQFRAIRRAQRRGARAAQKALVSPLAPKEFPQLPEIAGVRFATAQAGVRYKGRADVMLARIDPGASIAGVFTRSATRAAPVLDCEEKIRDFAISESASAILVNSGNANAFTGSNGRASVRAITDAVSSGLGIPERQVFTSSTGVIGEPLPHDRIISKIADLRDALSPSGMRAAAEAIMTTDTFAKGSSTEVEIDGQTVRIAGIAKGSGMIAPDMATMLVYIFTDAAVETTALQDILSTLNASTFNAITVDGDTSTSDSLLLVATGQSDAPMITSQESAQGRAFAAALSEVMLDLAKQVVRDGEGATKLVEIRVSGAASDSDARLVAMAIANSPLVKTAVAGEDPNWGRIVMAVGKSGALADRDKLSIRFGDLLVAEKGWVSDTYDEDTAARYMQNDEIIISTNLGLGSGQSTVWTCDLTKRYIEINADYRS